MSTYIRTLVSGAKARYKDKDLDVDLDLAYITDRVIVMGYPATGIEGIYRNNREDAKRFLEHRHGKSYWVFNLCPVSENSYPSSFFDGRVSRYPFPDHHAPPLAILPLVAREMDLWLRGAEDRVVVIHCKAGKGRSGTIACSYLLSQEFAMLPASDRPNGSADAVLMATETADEIMDIMPADEDTQKTLVEDTASDAAEAGTSPTASSKSDDAPSSASSRALNQTDTPTGARTPVSSARPAPLEHVLDLHTSKRMRALADKKATPADKQKKGVSIPSQRRWLLYWSLLLAGAGPRGFWGLHGPALAPPRLKVRVVSVRVRLREQRGAMPILARAVNTIMEQGGLGNRNAPGHRRDEVWVSLAKYDDKLVDTLESWERQTRVDDTKLGTRKPGSEHMEGADLVDMFKAGSWDKEKMVTTFSRFAASTKGPVAEQTDAQLGKLLVHDLTPLAHDKWRTLPGDASAAPSRSASFEHVDLSAGSSDVLVDPHREIRGKLYTGKIMFGWFWFIPAFHMPEPTSAEGHVQTRLTLGRKEVDFPLGIGKSLVDVEIVLEWHRPQA